MRYKSSKASEDEEKMYVCEEEGVCKEKEQRNYCRGMNGCLTWVRWRLQSN